VATAIIKIFTKVTIFNQLTTIIPKFDRK